MEPEVEADDSSSSKDVEALLDQQVRKIIDQLNKRDIATPFNEHASHDFQYEITWPDGRIVPLDLKETIDLMEHYTVEYNQKSVGEIISSDVAVDAKNGTAEVWVTLLVHNDNEGQERERIAIYTWWRAGAKDQRSDAGPDEWVWCKAHSSASRGPSMPHIT
ncbi:hypothetical protein CLAFUW4_10276 [Fulvia fulva]|uniref:uncharacterized protein n=1 Tax=Passalora fulva TaxID=5499 RepID=UPI0004E9EBA3|nr:uncharacterized protein CLAFUR5_20293 [Fulvia fulva]KAK4615882.1 hypothetical protein CLAFUR4_10280 [Fulvia fulva]KAK4616450.1 hypothetical protein CLAFUR0_10278 [Fulvia fulva]WMI38877.1 hypothetical protein CLAFUR5_20293 [Fulvia fulva]WPV19352.1 hypothetical protein CLAFUW4_10276 [Fulvia fulva]WPV34645.1 hypothetical protein CLAFUW7_10276 [Fulvia fulva]